MRSIQINFNSENRLPDRQCLGNKGEHNATELVITPPGEMLNNDKVECFAIVFQVGAHKLFRSDIHEKSETIRYKVPREVTVVNTIAVQLEGYDSKEELIVKSDVVENLYFNNSICGEETDGEDSESFLGEIVANTLARHTHENADVLEGLADDNGTLTYNGKPIGGSGSTERPTATVCTTYLEAELIVKTLRLGDGSFEIDQSVIGKEIADVKVKRANGELCSIKDMYTEDYVPHITMIGSFREAEVNGMTEIVFADIYYPSSTNWLYTEITANAIVEAEITYYTD